MSSPERNSTADKAAAQVSEAEANASSQRATDEVKDTKAQVDWVARLPHARKEVEKEIAAFKEFGAADLAQTKAHFKHTRDRLAAWDAEATHEFEFRLDTAQAQVAAWTAAIYVQSVEEKIQRHNDLASLKEKIALARARAAAARHAEYSAAAQDALREAADAFEEAYDAAQSKYNR